MNITLEAEQISYEEIYCFLDTDVLIHFTDFDKVDWVSFLRAKTVYLVVPITVIGELNKHKDDGSKPGLQQRARDILPKIAKLLIGKRGQPAPIRDHIFLMGTIREPRIDWATLELDENVNDDRVLGEILVFRETYPERNICFLTNDYASRLKVDDRGVYTLMPDGKYLTIKVLKSTVESQLEATRKELNEYKNRAPQIAFGFDENGKPTQRIVHLSSNYNADHAHVLQKFFGESYIPNEVIAKRDELLKNIEFAKNNRIDEKHVKEFIEDYKEYLEKLEERLKHTYMSKYGRRCLLNLLIENVGTAPITDLTICLTFPEGTLIIPKNQEDEEIIIPDEPHPSWNTGPRIQTWSIGAIIAPSTISTNPIYSLIREVRQSQATYLPLDCQNNYVTFRGKKLQHGNCWEMPTIIAYLIPKNDQGFTIEYEITNDQGLRKKSGSLNVLWEDPNNTN